ncbi:hypothetical protein BJ508DRAFT_33482 [Ascobolus immersus RN42]|uniref:Uncharacterized protein n=1 Tax=Ascobolus immersus RN42 TaxID=1160509 RepID=A0A3N4HRF2_ASCIM|nr:hypothetical protein BJ508DRAFT_33482 [Ascobolus immersus RN42]
MSLLLGMPADAAAHHRHEFSPTSPSQLTPTTTSFFAQLSFIRTVPEYSLCPRRPTIVLEEPEPPSTALGLVPTSPANPDNDDEDEEDHQVVITPPKRTTPKLKTISQLAYPPPHSLTLLKSKAPPLVQFQRLSSVPRPVPVYDLVGASTAASLLGRTALRAYPGAELVLVDSEQYDDLDSDTSDTDKPARSVVAGLSFTTKKDSPSLGQVTMQYGLTWDVKKIPSGFEFTLLDELTSTKRTARWVRRSSKRRQTLSSPTDVLTRPEDRYIFSVLSSSSRKHPILATLTRRRLELHDSPLRSSEESRPTSPLVTPSDEFPSTTSLSTTTTSSDSAGIPQEQLRTLIYATAAFVAISEQFSASHRDEVRMPTSPSRPTSPLLARGLTHLGHCSSPPATPPPRSATVGPGVMRANRRWTGDFPQRSASASIEASLAALTGRDEGVEDPPIEPAPGFLPRRPTGLTIPTGETPVRHSISLAEPSTPVAVAPVFKMTRASMPPPARQTEEVLMDGEEDGEGEGVIGGRLIYHWWLSRRWGSADFYFVWSFYVFGYF